MRIRHAALRNPDRLTRLQRIITGWPQVNAVSANPQAGSLLVLYDAMALREDDCARRCAAALAELLPSSIAAGQTPLPAPANAPTATLWRGGKALRVRANRLAKRAMLATLAASLLLAATGAKRGHISLGLAFLHALGVHLWAHRRHLLR